MMMSFLMREIRWSRLRRHAWFVKDGWIVDAMLKTESSGGTGTNLFQCRNQRHK
jgi:hypothetical protein